MAGLAIVSVVLANHCIIINVWGECFLKCAGIACTILQILSLTLFEKKPLDQLLKNMELQMDSTQNDNQLNLFN